MRRVAGVGLVGVLWGTLTACQPTRESVTAGRIGCKPADITISDESSTMGWTETAETWVAECRGRRFICTKASHAASGVVGTDPLIASTSDVECTEEVGSSQASAASPPAAVPAAPAEPATAPSPAPTGGAGFVLGAELAATQAACEAAGHGFLFDGEKTASCSGAATSLGFAVQMTFKLCGAKLCAIVAEHRPEADWTSAIAELRSKLEAKYGPPAVREGEIPLECRAKDAFVGCLKSRQIQLRYAWSWPTGQSITLTVGVAREGGEPAMRISWAKPQRGPAVNESAL